MPECSMPDCRSRPVGRGLCVTHYYGAKRAGNLDELAPKTHGPCEHCSRPIPVARRYGARFCSPDCKERERTRVHAAELMERRRGRRCILCSRRIPIGRTLKAETCSPECSTRWQNEQKATVRRAAWDAARPKCSRCGGEIPGSRRAGSLYCSRECKQNAFSARKRQTAPGYMRQYLYGITPEEFAALFESQGRRCAICGSDQPHGKGWHLDHSHETTAVRGILCHRCNLMLGHSGDDPARLRAALAYLER